MEKNQKILALVLDSKDNVATLLSDASKNDVLTLKGKEGVLQLSEDIGFGHKAALKSINEGEEIIKYDQIIGVATKHIKPGEWVHLHNIRSVIDPCFRKRIES